MTRVIAGILTFLFAKPGYMPSTAVTFLWSKPCKGPVQIPVGKSCEITTAGLGMESKTLRYQSTAGAMLRSKNGTYGKLSPAIPGPIGAVVTKMTGALCYLVNTRKNGMQDKVSLSRNKNTNFI